MSWPWESKAAVDGRFYAEHPTALTVTRSDTWSGPGFNVTTFGSNDDAAVMMKVQTAHLGNGNLRSLLLLDAASQAPLLAVEESRFGVAGQRRWEAFRGRDMKGADRLFVAVDKTRFLQMGYTVHVFLHGNSSGERVPDFVVRGSYLRGTMTVSRGGDDGADFVAQIRNESSLWASLVGENRYTLWIKTGVDQAFIIALAVILDQMQSPRHDAASRR
ncbi:protein LURP-one-related 10-like [Lolium perenne]|jgi:hypothetical protein|uniref:protein LURP-one-related 10-like n=1 Tax=Lolium perenne TaxID=4522 RepID=UPI0021EA8ED9|nr:protein LURP1-like [Lolium perenne]